MKLQPSRIIKIDNKDCFVWWPESRFACKVYCCATTDGFYRASYASAVLAVIGCPSVCPSVCLSVTSRSCAKMAKPRIKLRTAYDSPGTLVFGCQKSRRNSNDITPNGDAKWRWGRFESGDLYHRTTLPLRRSTATTLWSSAMIDANDAFTVAELSLIHISEPTRPY